MEKYSILLGYIDKQLVLIKKLYNEITILDVSVYENMYVFALKTQQFYTANEDLLKQIAKSFENHIQDMETYHKALLRRLNTEIPNIRPIVISNESLRVLDKIRAFRHFIRHAYNCELDEKELHNIQELLSHEYEQVIKDIHVFRDYVASVSLSK